MSNNTEPFVHKKPHTKNKTKHVLLHSGSLCVSNRGQILVTTRQTDRVRSVLAQTLFFTDVQRPTKEMQFLDKDKAAGKVIEYSF